MNSTTTRTALIVSLLASAALLGVCDRAGEGASGSTPNGAPTGTTAETTTGTVATDARAAGAEAGQAIGTAADAVANTTRDAAITTAITAKLAADAQLSALNIDVDTEGGRVVLKGSAPDTESRNRATELARTVDGVGDVSNELSVQPRQ